MAAAITVRDARCEDASGIARVHVDSWRTTYRGIVPADFLAGLSAEAREREWQPVVCAEPRRAFVYVAEDAGHVVGFASAGRARDERQFQSELYAIYLLESHQRRGVGRALVQRIANDLRGAGMTSMMLWVLAANPACRFYEALGGKRFGSQPVTIGGVTLEEIAYGWDDVRQLLPA